MFDIVEFNQRKFNKSSTFPYAYIWTWLSLSFLSSDEAKNLATGIDLSVQEVRVENQ